MTKKSNRSNRSIKSNPNTEPNTVFNTNVQTPNPEPEPVQTPNPEPEPVQTPNPEPHKPVLIERSIFYELFKLILLTFHSKLYELLQNSIKSNPNPVFNTYQFDLSNLSIFTFRSKYYQTQTNEPEPRTVHNTLNPFIIFRTNTEIYNLSDKQYYLIRTNQIVHKLSDLSDVLNPFNLSEPFNKYYLSDILLSIITYKLTYNNKKIEPEQTPNKSN
jgi:hypothetical protein